MLLILHNWPSEFSDVLVLAAQQRCSHRFSRDAAITVSKEMKWGVTGVKSRKYGVYNVAYSSLLQANEEVEGTRITSHTKRRIEPTNAKAIKKHVSNIRILLVWDCSMMITLLEN